MPSLLGIRICNDLNPVGNWSVNNRIVRQYNFEKQVLFQVLCEYFKNTQHAYIAGSCPSNCYSNPLSFNLTSKEFSRGSSSLTVENFPCFQYWNPAETTDWAGSHRIQSNFLTQTVCFEEFLERSWILRVFKHQNKSSSVTRVEKWSFCRSWRYLVGWI